MAQIIYHAGTGTHFQLDDDVMFIHTGDLPRDVLDELNEGHEVDLDGFGERLRDILPAVWTAN
jgi:hypothetical protein